jgi:hypothetical protein
MNFEYISENSIQIWAYQEVLELEAKIEREGREEEVSSSESSTVNGPMHCIRRLFGEYLRLSKISYVILG